MSEVPEAGAGVRPHTILAMVQDRPGVLHRIVECWQAEGYNIRSLAVGAGEQPGYSRMTFVVDAASDAEQLVKDLSKLEEIAQIEDVSDREFVSRELALVRVKGAREMRKRLMDIVDTFNAKIIDVAPESMMIEVTGHEHKIDSLVELLKDFEVLELVRTGRVSLVRGANRPSPRL